MNQETLNKLKSLADGCEGSEGVISLSKHLYSEISNRLKSKKLEKGGVEVSCKSFCELIQRISKQDKKSSQKPESNKLNKPSNKPEDKDD